MTSDMNLMNELPAFNEEYANTTDTQENTQKIVFTYTPRIETPNWFNDIDVGDDNDAEIWRRRAHNAYVNKDYQLARVAYETILTTTKQRGLFVLFSFCCCFFSFLVRISSNYTQRLHVAVRGWVITRMRHIICSNYNKMSTMRINNVTCFILPVM